MKKNTVLSRILVFFFALIIPWSILSVFFLETANQKISDATLRTIEQSRLAAIHSFEDQIVDTFTAASLSDTIDRATKLATLSGIQTQFERIQSVDQIQESLTLVKTLSPFVANSSVYIQSLNTVYNSAGHNDGSARVTYPGEFEELLSVFTNNLSLKYHQNKLIMLLGNNNDAHNCIMEVEFSTQQIMSTLTSSLEASDTSLYAFTLNDQVLTLENINQPDLLSAAMLATEMQESDTLVSFSYDRQQYYLFYYRSPILNFSYLELVPHSLVFRPVQLSTWFILIFSILTILVLIFFFKQSVRLIHNPLKDLTAGFDALRRGDFSTREIRSETDDFSYLYESFNHMATELNRLVTQNYQQQILLQKAELRQLQAQINPHFLYNSFFLLQRTIDSGDLDKSSEMARALGIYFRYVTKQNYDRVPLREEMEHARIYTDIQATRFSHRINIQFDDYPAAYADLLVPKLFLQPLIENAFKYGLEGKIQNGFLVISIQLTENYLIISIEDNGDTLSDEHLMQMQEQIRCVFSRTDVDNLSGLYNIAKRLIILYQDPNCFCVSRSSYGGVCVTVQIPLAEERSESNLLCTE